MLGQINRQIWICNLEPRKKRHRCKMSAIVFVVVVVAAAAAAAVRACVGESVRAWVFLLFFKYVCEGLKYFKTYVH